MKRKQPHVVVIESANKGRDNWSAQVAFCGIGALAYARDDLKKWTDGRNPRYQFRIAKYTRTAP